MPLHPRLCAPPPLFLLYSTAFLFLITSSSPPPSFLHSLPTACSKCQDGLTYAAGGCDGTTKDTVCLPCSVCQAGKYYAGGCVNGEDTYCVPCTPCKQGTYLSAGCDGVENSVCSPCSTSCPPGLFPAGDCTPERDLQCSQCKPCPAGTVTARACNSTTESLCLGTITVPDLPSVIVGQESRVLRIQLSIRATANLDLTMTGRGLQVKQGDRTNYNDQADFGEKNQSFVVRILKDESSADLTIVPWAEGRHPVNFSLSNAGAAAFVSLSSLTKVVYGLTRESFWRILFLCR